MTDLLAGLGFLLVIDGLLWAIAPEWTRRMYLEFAQLPGTVIQMTAVLMVAVGVLMVWLARG